MTVILNIDSLTVDYRGLRGPVRALDEVSLAVSEGAIVTVVGESGSGKSTLAAAVGRLLPESAVHVGGEIHVADKSLLDMTDEEIRIARRTTFGFIFQSPISSLDPTQRVGRQMRMAIGSTAVDLEASLVAVGLRDPQRVLASYPHQLSGGMAQRVAIAIAMAHAPSLLVADEPTASLDRTVQSLVADMLVRRSREEGAALLMFTHDLRLAARYSDKVAVMYGGRIVEVGGCSEVFEDPAHPYTRGLLAAAVGVEHQDELLRPIRGAPPVLVSRSSNCAFAPRCDWASSVCNSVRPDSVSFRGRQVACHYLEAVNGNR